LFYLLCQRELEVSLCVIVRNIGYNLGQSIVICRELAAFYPVTDQVAQDTAEILMSGVGQEASGVGQHSYESGQITQVSQGDHLILHAGLVIIEPPGGTLLDLGNSGGILETSEDGTDSLIVVRIQAVNDSSGKLVTYDQSVQEVSHLSGRSVVVDAVVTGIGTQLLEHQAYNRSAAA